MSCKLRIPINTSDLIWTPCSATSVLCLMVTAPCRFTLTLPVMTSHCLRVIKVIFPAILNRCKRFDLSQFTSNSLNSESSKIQNLTNNLAICELLQIKLVSIDVRISELKVKWLQCQSLQLISFFVHQSLDLRVLRATWWLLNYVTCCNRGTFCLPGLIVVHLVPCLTIWAVFQY